MFDDVPDGWAWAKLADVAKIAMGETLLSKDLTGVGVPVFSANTNDGPWGYTDKNRKTLSRGTIVVGARGSIGFPRLPPFDAFTCTQTTISIEPDRSSVDSAFLFNALQTADIKGLAALQAIPMLTIGALAPLAIPVPPLDEQRRIAEVLRSVDEAIAQTKSAAEQAGRAVEGMLQRLFVEGIGHTDFKDGHSTSIPASWCEMSLGDLSAVPITYGVVQPGPNVVDGVPFVRGGDFPNGKIDIGALRKIGKNVASQYRRTQLRGGELVVSLVGYPGACAIVPDDLAGANIARQAALIRPAAEIAANYLYQFLRSPIGQARLKKETIGSAQQVINLRDLKEVIVAVPPKREQEQIAAILADLDAFVELETANLDKLTTLKTHLMSDLLSGRVRVPE